jgi:hypothetical protein
MCQERRRGRLPVESTIPFSDPIAGRKPFSHTQIRQGSGAGFASLIISEIVAPWLTSFPLPFTLFFKDRGALQKYRQVWLRGRDGHRNTVLSIFPALQRPFLASPQQVHRNSLKAYLKAGGGTQ